MPPHIPPIEWIRPTNAEDWEAYQRFRWVMLRAAWLPEQSPEIAVADHAAAEHWLVRQLDGEVLACGQLIWLGEGLARLRNMAVAPSHQGTGLGRKMLLKLEEMARGRGCDRIVAQARDSALAFYQHAGYRLTQPGETLFEHITHTWVEKDLDCSDFSRFGLKRKSVKDADAANLSSFIFGVLAEYGLQPEHDGIDQDLLAPATTYQGGFFDALWDAQNRIVGTLAVLPISDTEAELRRMYLSPSARGNGLGRACLGYALQRARHCGIRTLHLETASVLREALGLYAWAGFSPHGGSLHAQRCDQSLILQDF